MKGGQVDMKNWKKITGMSVCVLICGGCGFGASGPGASGGSLETLFSYDGEMFRPGVLEWGDSREDILETLAISEKQIYAEDEYGFTVRDVVPEVTRGSGMQATFNIYDIGLNYLTLTIMPEEERGEETLLEITEWIAENVPVEPDVNGELWETGPEEFVKNMMAQREDQESTLLWNGEVQKMSEQGCLQLTVMGAGDVIQISAGMPMEVRADTRQ